MSPKNPQAQISRLQETPGPYGAARLELPDGRRIWVWPMGADHPRPFWCHVRPPKDLTDAELEEFGFSAIAKEKT